MFCSCRSTHEDTWSWDRTDVLEIQCSDCGGYILSVGQGDQDTLVTVIDGSGISGDINKKWLEDFILETETTDDVFDKAFLYGLVITRGTGSKVNVTDDADEYLEQLGNAWFDHYNVRAEHLTPGLYLLHEGRPHPVCRLHSDHQKSFLAGLHPSLAHGRVEEASSPADMTLQEEKQKPGCGTSHPFRPLHITGGEYNTLAIAVPSRLTTNSSRTNPPLRIAVKDVFSLHGLKTSLCNAAYYRLSLPSTSTAHVVQTLADEGHHIVGLTKLSSMMAREEPMDAVDFQTAFNPRGDGYQSPSGSSSGSAAAAAAYDWLDCAIGTDTSGSGRRPALVNGVFQFRPSHDSFVSLGGMVGTFPWFDTPVVFARSLSVLGKVFSAWLPENRVESLWGGMEVVYPLDYLQTAVPEQVKLIDSFVGDLATCFECSVTKISLRDSWRECPPDGADPDMEAYLQDVIVHTYCYSYYHLTSGWRDKYKDRFGHEPYVIPFVKQCWSSGAAVTPQQHEEGLKRLEVYRKWLLDTLFLSRGNKTLVVLPISPVEPHYRDERSESPQYQSATDELFLSPILKAPDVVVPIGEVPYESRISGRREWLPVGVNLVGAPGMEKWLFDAVTRVLKSSGRPDTVSSGSRIFGNRE